MVKSRGRPLPVRSPGLHRPEVRLRIRPAYSALLLINLVTI